MPKLTIKEELADAIKLDGSFVAHAIYYALQKGLVQLDDPSSSLPYPLLDYDIIRKWMDINYLQLCTVKLFKIPVQQNRQALYLAHEENEARAQHYKMYGYRVERIMEAPHEMDTSLYCEETGKHRVIRDMKRKTVEFPCWVGEVGR
ncbi:hypothetical protein QT711_14340 [Sporosarcina saromensis]|uniref:Uncharacterized protein n=1 Tax=Sporosarcina saromensis TaxID=359365 RepID=A0ABU4GBK1_9BACL|nr:hypothetical protein [Sporosarcina saromensis]MDW0114373.1 hypothetical protein [Sporosarcina saromensis]